MTLGFDEYGRLLHVYDSPQDNAAQLHALSLQEETCMQSVLDLRWVPLIGLPIENFRNLKALYLHDNQIQELPELHHFSSLQVLSLGKNQICTLPASIKNLWMSLRFLFLGENQISSLPFHEDDMMLFHGSVGHNPIPEPIGVQWMFREDAKNSISALHLLSRTSAGLPYDVVQDMESLFLHNCKTINEPTIFSYLFEGYQWEEGRGLFHEQYVYPTEISALTQLLNWIGPEVIVHPTIGKRLVHQERLLEKDYWFSSM